MGSRLKKNLIKANFEKGLVNLIEKKQQITTTSDNFFSSINSFKTHLNAKGFNMFLTL